LSFSPDDRRLAVGSSKSSVQVWACLEGPSASSSWESGKAVRSLFWSDDGGWRLAQAQGESPTDLDLDGPVDPDNPFISLSLF